jgi:heat shock protein HslJ
LLIVLLIGACCGFEAAASELTGTAWRLVRILSMDDRIDVPDNRGKYMLELRADGTATMQSDCSRGNGSWRSESAGKLLFGSVVATRALCPPGSLSEKYLAQFEWVRSYMVEDGHLFLATMADGSVIEFEPAGEAPPAGTVPGEAVHGTDPGRCRTSSSNGPLTNMPWSEASRPKQPKSVPLSRKCVAAWRQRG